MSAEGPRGDLGVPRGGDGVWEVHTVRGRPCLTPDERSHYLYFHLPPAFRARGSEGLWVEVEYFGDRYAQFRVQYASTDAAAEHGGLYKAAEQRWDVHFERIAGVIHRPQPAATLARMETVLAAESTFSLAALRMLASLAASLVIALAAIAPGADAEALWAAANLEEDWQAELWGKDAEAEARRERRFASFAAAMHFAELAR